MYPEEKNSVAELCIGETTVKAWGKKLTRNDTAFTVKFLLNSKETHWKLYGTWSLDLILLKDYSDWQTHFQIKVFGPNPKCI